MREKKSCKKKKKKESGSWVTDEISEEIKNYLETNENTNILIQSLFTGHISSKTNVYSYADLTQEERKISNNLTLHLKELEKDKQIKHKISRRKETIK